MRTRWHCTSEWDSRRSGDSRRSCGKGFRVCLEIIWGVGSGNERVILTRRRGEAEEEAEKQAGESKPESAESAESLGLRSEGARHSGMAAWKATLLQDGEHVGEVVCPDSEGAFLAEEFGLPLQLGMGRGGCGIHDERPGAGEAHGVVGARVPVVNQCDL